MSRCDSCEKKTTCGVEKKELVMACIKHSEFDKPRVTWEELSPKMKEFYRELEKVMIEGELE